MVRIDGEMCEKFRQIRGECRVWFWGGAIDDCSNQVVWDQTV